MFQQNITFQESLTSLNSLVKRFSLEQTGKARIALRKKRTKEGKASNRTMMEKCGLTASSEPWEFADIFLPFSRRVPVLSGTISRVL